MDALDRRQLLTPIVEAYTEAGIDARLTEDGMLVVVPEGVVTIEAVPRFIPATPKR